MSTSVIIQEEVLVEKIYFIRGLKVMLDFDLAELYEVETKLLKRQVKRNIERFPADFMFELSKEELKSLRRQFGTLKRGEHAKYLPFAFTEQGVAMLSGVLKSARAIEVNIAIMRTFVQIRRLMDSNKDIAKKIQELELKYDEQFQVVFNAIRELIHHKNEPREAIGYKINEK